MVAFSCWAFSFIRHSINYFSTNSKDVETSALDEISSASKIYAFGHSEVDTRYDETYIKTKANYKNDAVFLTGQKSFVLNGDYADKIICTARFSGNDFDQNGFGLYEIDKTHCDIRSYNTIDGYRAAELKFSEIPAKELCKNSDAYNALLETLYAGAFALSAESIGAMEVCFNMTLEYLKTREQFGKAIGSFQALQHRMVDIMIEIEQAKSAVMLAAGTYEADKDTKYKNISAAKNLVGRAGKLVAEECIQLHGGIAMTWEYNLHNYAKRLVMIDHLMGDSDHHLEKFKLYSNYWFLIKRASAFFLKLFGNLIATLFFKSKSTATIWISIKTLFEASSIRWWQNLKDFSLISIKFDFKVTAIPIVG